MGLKNTYDSTVKDLKATFFDLFCEHTEELARLIELLATDATVDVMKIESLIFQRIIMLNKTAGSVKSLMTSVDELSMVKGSGLKETKKNNVSKKPIEVVQTNSEPVTTATVVTTPVAAPTTVPVAAPTTAPVAVPTTAPVAVPTTAPVAVPTTAPVAAPTTAPVAAPTTVPAEVSTTAPLISTPSGEKESTVQNDAEKKSLNQTLTERANNLPPRGEKKLRFIKASDSKVKAILVNDRQYQKLKASYVIQVKSLDFSTGTGPAPTKQKIEDLMKKASALYKEGKISEAQALYAEISALNKQVKKTDNKVLIKAA